MVVLADEYVEPDIIEFIESLNISNDCTLISTNVVSNLSMFLDRIIKMYSDNKVKKISVIIPKSEREDLARLINSIGSKYKIVVYIFISERLASNVILLCKEKSG